VVGAAVDHHGVVPELRGQLRGVAVRQGEEHDVVTVERGRGRVLQHAVRQRQEVRLVRTQARARAPARRECPDLHVRMPEEFSPGVSARPRYRYPHHAYDYARWRKLMQTDS
jgi:hypothetical protein